MKNTNRARTRRKVPLTASGRGRGWGRSGARERPIESSLPPGMAAEGYTAQHVCTGHPPHAIKRTCGCYGAPQVSKCRRLRNEDSGGRSAGPPLRQRLSLRDDRRARGSRRRAGGRHARRVVPRCACGRRERRACAVIDECARASTSPKCSRARTTRDDEPGPMRLASEARLTAPTDDADQSP